MAYGIRRLDEQPFRPFGRAYARNRLSDSCEFGTGIIVRTRRRRFSKLNVLNARASVITYVSIATTKQYGTNRRRDNRSNSTITTCSIARPTCVTSNAVAIVSDAVV